MSFERELQGAYVTVRAAVRKIASKPVGETVEAIAPVQLGPMSTFFVCEKGLLKALAALARATIIPGHDHHAGWMSNHDVVAKNKARLQQEWYISKGESSSIHPSLNGSNGELCPW